MDVFKQLLSLTAHHASFQSTRGQTFVDQFWIDWQLDAKRASLRYIQLGNHTPEHHAGVEKVWQRADFLQSIK